MSESKFFDVSSPSRSICGNHINVLSEYKIAKAFYEKALQYYYKEEFLNATFMMQQATRFAYYNLVTLAEKPPLKYATLKVMKLYISSILPDFKDVFHHKSENERQLFTKMDMALPEKRLVPELLITEEEILQLLERVEELLELSKEFFYELFDKSTVINTRD